MCFCDLVGGGGGGGNTMYNLRLSKNIVSDKFLLVYITGEHFLYMFLIVVCVNAFVRTATK